jgi:hypothetical protein
MNLDSHIAGTGADIKVQRLDDSRTVYRLSDFNSRSNPLCQNMARTCKPVTEVNFVFQSGALQERGRNGVTAAALLAVVLDHLQGQDDQRAQTAAAGVAAALEVLQARATERVTDGTDPIEAPCPCAAGDKKCSAPLPSTDRPQFRTVEKKSDQK